jgi:hypothetical protein
VGHRKKLLLASGARKHCLSELPPQSPSAGKSPSFPGEALRMTSPWSGEMGYILNCCQNTGSQLLRCRSPRVQNHRIDGTSALR